MAGLTFTLPEIASEFDAQYRTLHSWVESGLIAPSGWPSDGTGHASVFTEADVEVIGRLVKLRRLGLSIDGLRRAVADPQGLAGELAEALAEARPSHSSATSIEPEGEAPLIRIPSPGGDGGGTDG